MDNLTKLRYWTFKILPLVYDDSLSYYEVLTKVTNKVNELIDSNNAMPQAITDEVKKQLSSDELAARIMSGLVNAIATDEGTNTFTKDSKNGGELIFLNGTLYKVTAVMQAGTNYIVGTNIIPVNISDELKIIKETYISSNNEHWNERSAKDYVPDEYLFWKDDLYITTKYIKVNDILYNNGDNQNIKQVTLASEITNLQSQINNVEKNRSKIYLNPYDFGFKGDGSDETNAIQATIDKAESLVTNEKENSLPTFWGMPCVLLPAGIINISNPLTISKSIELMGQGPNTRIRATQPMDYMIKIINSDISINEEHQLEGVHIHDICMDGNYRKYSITNAIYLQNADHATLYNIYFWCIKGSGLTYTTVRETVAQNLFFRWCGTTTNATINMPHTNNSENNNLNVLNNTWIIFSFGPSINIEGGDLRISNLTIHGIFPALHIGTHFPDETYTNNFAQITATNSIICITGYTWSWACSNQPNILGTNSKISLSNIIGGGHYAGTTYDYELNNNSLLLLDKAIAKAAIKVKNDETSKLAVTNTNSYNVGATDNILKNNTEIFAGTTLINYSGSYNIIKPSSDNVDGAIGFIAIQDTNDNNIINIHNSGIYCFKKMVVDNKGTMIIPKKWTYETTQYKGTEGAIWIDDNGMYVRIGDTTYKLTATPI